MNAVNEQKSHPSTRPPVSSRGKGARIRALRRSASLLAVAGLVCAGLAAMPPVAQARIASGGSSPHAASVEWFDWTSHAEAVPRQGLTRTETRKVGEHSLATTCTLSKVAGNLSGYRPGSRVGDGFHRLYNSEPSVTERTVGIVGQNPRSTSSFTVKCETEVNGQTIPHKGLVFGDARSPQAGTNERITLQPSGRNFSWRMLDQLRPEGCRASTHAYRWLSQRLDLSVEGSGCHIGPSVSAFAERADEARVELRGGGVAIGVMLPVDFGDAPESYGQAGALMHSQWSGGTLPQSRKTDVTTRDFTPAQHLEPQQRLGRRIDADPGYLASSDARLDDTTGLVPGDEEAIGAPLSLRVRPGERYVLGNIRCSGQGAVAGWIDWNGNGRFDAEERSSGAGTCNGSSASLQWNVPRGIRPATAPVDTFLRLRIGDGTDASSRATGLSLMGEVEDHAVTISVSSP